MIGICIILTIVLMMSNFTIASLNVHGLRNQVKRRQILDSCNSQGVDILLLQETHATGHFEARAWAREFGGKGFWSFGTSSSCGVAILLSRRHLWNSADYFRDNCGRLVSVTVTIPNTNTKVRVVNCYAPNDPGERRILFSEQLSSHFRGSRHIVLAGDFNCISDLTLDSKNVKEHFHSTRGYKELFHVTQKFGLEDVWRIQNPQQQRFTWHHHDKKRATRIDKIYMSRELSAGSKNEIIAFPLSDHDMVIAKIPDKIKHIASGFWRCNTNFLTQDLFQKTIKSEWECWRNKRYLYDNLFDWWDMGKLQMKKAIISFSADMSRKRNSERKDLLRELNQLQQQIDGGDMACNSKFDKAQSKFLKIAKKQEGGHFHKSNCPEIKGEHNTHCPDYISLDSKRMPGLKDRDGLVTTDPEEMNDICHRFYRDLYTATPVDQNQINFILSHIDTVLGPEEQLLLEGPVTLAEIKRALFDMDIGKSPGSDGLPAEFYKTFFSDMGQDICDVVNTVFEQELLSPTQRNGLISLLYKNKGSRDELTNWRPISLLNVDYKIISKILATRMRQILYKIINIDQTCSVAGRSISDNAHLLRNVQSYVDQKNLGAVFLSLDQQKAFDRVNWGYLQQVLEKFGFGPNFRKWVQILYTEINSSVICNGNISQSFSLSRGVRQGCPLSPLLYILSIEPLACAIRADPNIQGVILPGGTEVKISMYADDTTLILSNERSIKQSFVLVERYERASGAKLNQQKTNGVFLGRWKYKLSGPVDISWVTSAKIIGFYFGYNDPSRTVWDEKISDIRKAIAAWENSDLSMKGKVTVVNNFILSKLWYLAEVIPPPKNRVKLINRLVFQFIWGMKTEYVNRETLHLLPSKGGLGVIDIKSKVVTLQGIHVGNIVSGKKAKWKSLARYWCGFSLRDIAPELAHNNTPHCFTRPKFYISVLKNFRENTDNVADWKNIKHQNYLASLMEARETKPRVERGYPGKDWATVWKRSLCYTLTNRQFCFNFKMIHNVLPTGSRLRRQSKDRGLCPYCNFPETRDHIFALCKKTKPVGVWLSNYLGSLLNKHVSPDIDTIVFSLFPQPQSKRLEHKVNSALSAYRITLWTARNQAKYDNKISTPDSIIRRIKHYLK